MSEIGRAALLSIDLENPDAQGAMWAVFEEQPGDPPHAHPVAKCWALWEATKDDWPTHVSTVAANERALRLKAAYMTSALLGTDYEQELSDAETAERGEA